MKAQELTSKRAKVGVAAGAAVATGATVAAKALLDRRDTDRRQYRLRCDEDVADGITRIATGRADSAIEHLRGKSDLELAGAIHETRKDLKKLRSALRLVRDPLGDELYRRENIRFREAGRLLSGTRDAEVKLETLAALRDHFPGRFPHRGAGPLTKALEGERQALSERAAREDGQGPAAPAAEQIEAGREAISDWGLDGDGFELIKGGLRRSYSRGRKGFAASADDPSPENVHEWRKRVKDLWYHLRLIRDARPGKLGKAGDRAHELSGVLGDHHDLTVLREDATARSALLPAQALATLEELIERRQSELVESATPLGEKLYSEKPKDFVARIEGYWTQWR
jgi:CHAD domain-containing protein